MSQSPIEDFSAASVERYQQGWQALNRLLHENRSFSGQERHCAYLNCGSGAFANVSAVTGLDFPEDGRAIGPVDWDFDGDLDLWISNRTAPRARFMLNQTEGDNAFLELHLEGDGKRTNRDAIGARVVLEKVPKPIIRTTHAGESFLSQWSSWIHFGLGKQSTPVDAVVYWPNAEPERFVGLQPRAFYKIRQGSGTAVPWTPPSEGATFAADATPLTFPPAESKARIVLTAGLPLPTLKEIDTEGKETILNLSGPTVVNAWASWCRPCLEELSAWTAAQGAFKQAGLSVLALAADEDAEGQAKGATILEKLQFPYRSAVAAPGSIRALDLTQRATLDLWETMPVPCSFLVDNQGYVRVIYKGPVAPEQLVADMKLFNVSPRALRDAAVPYPGVWTHDPATADPLRVTTQFVDFALVREGLEYLQKATAMDQKFRSDQFTPIDIADRYHVTATLLREQGMHEQAFQAYETARDLNPKDARIHHDLATYYSERGQMAKAIISWKALLALNPSDLDTATKLATLQVRTGQAKEALGLLDQLVAARPAQADLRFYQGLARQANGDTKGTIEAMEKALALAPGDLAAGNGLAWILATHPDAQFRNGSRALALIEAVSARAQHRHPGFLATLAAAQAESGQYKEAATTMEKALAIAGASANPQAAGIDRLKERLSLFQAGQPYRDASLASK